MIVGGGIAGLTAGYLLAKAGQQVTLVEDGLIGSGESGRTTAHLTCALDDRYYELQHIFGKDKISLIADSHREAITQIERIVHDLHIDCNFQRIEGYLFLHPSDKIKNLEKEFTATQDAGLNTRWVENIPGIATETGPAILFPDQAQFHIMKYLHGLAKGFTLLGGQIYTQSKATDINKKGAVCNGHKITARHIVVATNTPTNDLVTMHTKQFPFRTYVIAATIPKGSLQPALWWDTGDMKSRWFSAPYHYVRTEPFNEMYDLLISGGEDHKTGQADTEDIPEEKRYENLINWTRTHFPMINEIVYKWSGQVMEPLDSLAFIGKNPGNDNVYIITGDSGNGMTHGTLGGMIICDMITGQTNPWASLYAPNRLPFKVPGRYLKEVANMAAQYADWITKADIKEIHQLAAGEGAILGKGLKRYAVYKDEDDHVHVCSAMCTHLACVVQWNAEEKTFDCPCHGSRFTKEGVVINGPATTNLKTINVEQLMEEKH
jgi:glycine/D-amino acid oxidase-like deaminating enzyme/nitrite reductase/ring-hydroxylating ferredoxin subunit